MVEGTYEETDIVVCKPGISEEFRVDVCLRQGSALSPLLLITVVNQQESEYETHSPQVDIRR